MSRLLGVAALVAVALLGVGIAGSETAKAAKKSEAATQVPTPTPMPAGKAGGTLNVMLREDLSQGFAVHEAATISVVFPSSPCFNNLVMFDPANPVENPDSVVPELAEKWSWQDNYRNLVMFLRKNVKWHDGLRCSCSWHPAIRRSMPRTSTLQTIAPAVSARDPSSSRNGAGASSSNMCGTRTTSSRIGPISTGSST